MAEMVSPGEALPKPVKLRPPSAPLTARMAVAGFSVSTTPALQPAFDPSVTDYVSRCEPGAGVVVAVTNTDGTSVSVDGRQALTTSYTVKVPLASGQRFTIRTGTAAHVTTYSIRCLPPDFPRFSAESFPLSGKPQAAYYLMTPGLSLGPAPQAPYVTLFNDQGVPVWWYRQPTGTPIDANLLANGSLSWDVEYQQPSAYGLPNGVAFEQHTLSGQLTSTFGTFLWPTDFHESMQLPSGNFLITSYVLNPFTNLSSIGVPEWWRVSVLNAGFQEITPQGQPVGGWDSNGFVQPAESLRWWNQFSNYPWPFGPVWDMDHINSIAPDGNDFLVSFRHTDAVYLINGTNGRIMWKLGGTPTPQSLTILGDPDGATDFGGQHDARVLSNGEISLFDDGTNRDRPPRVLVFRVNPEARTATLVESFTDPTGTVTTAPCCGSARRLPGGDWVVGWGGNSVVDELAPTGPSTAAVVLRITFASPYFTYRAVPVLPGELTDASLEMAMDQQFPRAAGG
jgi:Arylsulfotransferase (ASST)